MQTLPQSLKILAFGSLLLVLCAWFLLAPHQAHAQIPLPSCDVNAEEWHPLRPYPGEICGPEAERTIDETDGPYCAMRPWAVQVIEYMKNEQDCAPGDPNFPCILGVISGDYSIDLTAYELTLVSVNRPNFNYLTFFNRAQEHLADYLEGRSYYEGIVEPTPGVTTAYIPVWNRLGLFRKLTPVWKQDELKRWMTEVSGGPHHDYIVGYVSGGEVSNWRNGTPVRLEQLEGHAPPAYTCTSIQDPLLQDLCHTQWLERFNDWSQTIYGKLWPYVPMVTREDAKGWVRVFPEPGQPFTAAQATEDVSIPHLPRLDAISSRLQDALSSRLRVEEPFEEGEPNEGLMCPAGPWLLSGAACSPGGAGGGGAGCSQPPNCRDVAPFSSGNNNVKDMDTLIAEFWNVPEENIRSCYWDVIDRSISAGYDPSFAMAIWLEESGGSDYGSYADVADFGCVSSSRCDFNAQIDCFLGLKSAYQSPAFDGCRYPGNSQMDTFLLIYSDGFRGCRPQCDDEPACCNNFCTNPQFPGRISEYYPRVHRNWAPLPNSP